MPNYNLPPGVRVSDLPGHTPADEEFEKWNSEGGHDRVFDAVWEAIEEAVAEEYDPDDFKHLSRQQLIDHYQDVWSKQ